MIVHKHWSRVIELQQCICNPGRFLATNISPEVWHVDEFRPQKRLRACPPALGGLWWKKSRDETWKGLSLESFLCSFWIWWIWPFLEMWSTQFSMNEIPKKDIHLGFVMLQVELFLGIRQVIPLMNSSNHYASLGSLSSPVRQCNYFGLWGFLQVRAQGSLLWIDLFEICFDRELAQSQSKPAEIGSTGKQRPRIPLATAPFRIVGDLATVTKRATDSHTSHADDRCATNLQTKWELPVMVLCSSQILDGFHINLGFLHSRSQSSAPDRHHGRPTSSPCVGEHLHHAAQGGPDRCGSGGKSSLKSPAPTPYTFWVRFTGQWEDAAFESHCGDQERHGKLLAGAGWTLAAIMQWSKDMFHAPNLDAFMRWRNCRG